MKPEQLAALITASSGIIIAVLAMAERARTKGRTQREASAARALDSWESFTRELRESLVEQEKQYQILFRDFASLQKQISDARVQIARHEATEADQARRITALTAQVRTLNKRLDRSSE